MSVYVKWTAQLKNELRIRSAPISGNKSALVERITAYDRNDNFSQVVDQTVDESFSTTDVNSYRNLNAGKLVPTVTEQHVVVYLQRKALHFSIASEYFIIKL
ncbi:hypothetical protein B566_EDAN013320 [Ephemera danica]|nr:hypothetical protein B566_EDAN013320 [Ephemera danica]